MHLVEVLPSGLSGLLSGLASFEKGQQLAQQLAVAIQIWI